MPNPEPPPVPDTPRDPFTLEVSAHRIGGTDLYERTFAPRNELIYPQGQARTCLQGALFSTAVLYVETTRWTLVRPSLWSAQMMLSDINGSPVGPPRPVFASALPSDVPLYSSHIATNPEHGIYSVGLRLPRCAWTDADTERLAQDAEADNDGR